MGFGLGDLIQGEVTEIHQGNGPDTGKTVLLVKPTSADIGDLIVVDRDDPWPPDKKKYSARVSGLTHKVHFGGSIYESAHSEVEWPRHTQKWFSELPIIGYLLKTPSDLAYRTGFIEQKEGTVRNYDFIEAGNNPRHELWLNNTPYAIKPDLLTLEEQALLANTARRAKVTLRFGIVPDGIGSRQWGQQIVDLDLYDEQRVAQLPYQGNDRRRAHIKE